MLASLLVPNVAYHLFGSSFVPLTSSTNVWSAPAASTYVITMLPLYSPGVVVENVMVTS